MEENHHEIDESRAHSSQPSPAPPSATLAPPQLNGDARSRPQTPSQAAAYVNPLDSSSRWYLSARANIIRNAASLGMSIANRTDPPAPAPTRDVWLDSTLSAHKGPNKIKVELWIPPKVSFGARCAVINFHGGGWILGAGTDDARWAGAVMASLDAIVFTVNYRLAPSYPFPTPLEDCIDAICQIARRAAEFSIDPDKIILSGFSAGASNAISSWVALQDPERFGYKLPFNPPTTLGLVLFYPVLDWTISRPEKRLASCRPEMTLPSSLTDLIDASYVYPPIPRAESTDPRMSPGLMPDDLLRKLPPIHLILCEFDMLLAEGLQFAARVRDAKREITCRIVEGEGHAWNMPPPMTPKESVHAEYAAATQSMANWLGTTSDTDRESVNSISTKRLTIKRPGYLSFRSKTSR